jgi:hypothetical protein
MERRLITKILLAVCGLVMSAFLYAQESTEPSMSFVGRIIYVSLEGGFYGIESDNGNKFNPLNLPKQFKRPGLLVQVNGIVKQVFTHRMWGQSIYIDNITTISCKSSKREGCTP